MHGVSLVSWNLLAPLFATQHKYPWAAREHLDWPVRQAKIVDALADFDADIVCLQEVEVARWDELLRRLGDLGYDGVLQKMSRGHPIANVEVGDGCAPTLEGNTLEGSQGVGLLLAAGAGGVYRKNAVRRNGRAGVECWVRQPGRSSMKAYEMLRVR